MTATTETVRRVRKPRNYETRAWVFMRFSGILLIPLVYAHVLIQDVLVGVHAIDLDYVAMRWAMLSWRIYDIALLGLAFAHGMNGLRTVLRDYLHDPKLRRWLDWGLLVFWLLVTAIGAIAIIGGVKSPA